MVEDIYVYSRKDFMTKLRELFIPNMANASRDFNIGYALNHWTEFFIWIGNTFYWVRLKEN